jgi:hypothetical protein
MITLALGAPALAQTTAPDPKACAPGERMPPQEEGGGGTIGQAPPDVQKNQTENLSDKLARTEGVICPPEIGKDMRLPTPEGGGQMPVIPPPGSPGGDPSVKPK